MNIIRLHTLFKKECMRFFRVYHQTILSPVVNALIFYLIFTVAFAGRSKGFDGTPFNLIVATGLIAMSALQAAYFNTQSTISIAKMLGFIKDYTIAPLTTIEMYIAMVISSVVRAMCVASITFCIMMFFVSFPVHSVFISLYYIILGTILFASIGVFIGFIAQDFDKAHAYTAYIVTPLTMLSGTFYSASILPEPWKAIVLFNPVFYIIDGFRFGMTGIGEGHSLTGAVMILSTVVFFGIIGVFALKKGTTD
ncbi:MAG: ABC-2 type transport system permease protein [Candidatus Deianiraeaceae bacterium]|jgi:ABC-2 type transport system permease protein